MTPLGPPTLTTLITHIRGEWAAGRAIPIDTDGVVLGRSVIDRIDVPSAVDTAADEGRFNGVATEPTDAYAEVQAAAQAAAERLRPDMAALFSLMGADRGTAMRAADAVLRSLDTDAGAAAGVPTLTGYGSGSPNTGPVRLFVDPATWALHVDFGGRIVGPGGPVEQTAPADRVDFRT